LALNDEATVESALATVLADFDGTGLDAKSKALARVAALISVGSAEVSYQWAVSVALAVGASEEEIVGVLAAVAPIVGIPRMNSAAFELSRALGFDDDGPP
jgi:alkylhydroperoxidase/carboxymuconolactone decarboxylase family protein YurZ